jgi:hypothetical protein
LLLPRLAREGDRLPATTPNSTSKLPPWGKQPQMNTHFWFCSWLQLL